VLFSVDPLRVGAIPPAFFLFEIILDWDILIIMDSLAIKNGDAPDKIDIIAGALNDGKVLILPAATVYGISARHDNKKALEKIYRIKKRSSDMPFIILISNKAQLKVLVKETGTLGQKLIEKYWDPEEPRPLTLIFKKSKIIGSNMSGGRDTIAVRMAGLKIVRDIIDISGPIVSTSANISGQDITADDIGKIPRSIRREVDMTVRLDGGLKGTESTIVDVSGEKPVLIREGAISFDSILKNL
jgi:L-threonylcarbamoyladenylate synthase